jgi:hypothetical protein
MKTVEQIRDSFVDREAYPTAILCLLSVVRYHGGIIEPQFLEVASKTLEGVTKLSHLADAADTVGLFTKGVRSSLDHLKKITHPVILFVNNDQGKSDYMVCYGYDGRFLVGVPTWGLTQFSDEEVLAVWDSRIMLYLEPTDRFVLEKEQEKRKRRWMLDKFSNAWMSMLFFLFFTSLFLVAFFLGINFLQINSIEKSIVFFSLSVVFLTVCIGFKNYGIKAFDLTVSEIMADLDTSSIPDKQLKDFFHVTCSFFEYILSIPIICMLVFYSCAESSIWVLGVAALLTIWVLFKLFECKIKIKQQKIILFQLYDFCTYTK